MSKDDKVDALRNELPPFNIDDNKYQNLKYALGLIPIESIVHFYCNKNRVGIRHKAKDGRPPVDVGQVADQMLYYELIAIMEQPKWRQDLIKEHGPAGVSRDGFNNYRKAMLWEWNYDQMGDWPVDIERDLTCDGKRFWKKKANGRRKRMSLERWLTERMQKENPDVFKDCNWKYKKMYFEYIKITEVSNLPNSLIVIFLF